MESISEPFIRRPVMTVLLAVTLAIGGIFCYKSMPVSDLPSVDYPVIVVNSNFPGMDPLTMAANVASPLEKEFMKIQGLEMVTSSSMQGATRLILQFSLDKDIDGAAMDVQSAISRAAGSLPSDLPSPPVFRKTNPSNEPIYYIVLKSDTVTRGDLCDYANDEIAQRISTINGVSEANVYGLNKAVKILVNNEKLYNKGITIDDVKEAVKGGTVSLAAGEMKSGERTLSIKPNGQLNKASEYLNLIVAYKNGTPIFLKDIADCIDKLENDNFSASFWKRGCGEPTDGTVVVAITRAAGANAIELSKKIDNLLPVFRDQIPASIDVIKMYDRSINIGESVDDVKLTLVIAFGLVVAVIFLFIGRISETIIPIVALPMSLLMTFIVMHALGYSIDNLSLMALTLSIGLLVDDAIVFLENMIRRMEDFGESPVKASIEGAKEISFSILSMTLSLAAVFIPLVFMSGQIGRIFKEFSVTIIVAILSSGIVSLTLTPMMCARMLKPIDKNKRSKLEIWSSGLEHRFLAVYSKMLDWCISHKGISIWIWVLSLVGTFFSFIQLPKSFLPDGDSGMLRVLYVAEEGTSPSQMREYKKCVLDKAMENKHIDTVMGVSGISGMLTSNQGMSIMLLNSGKRPSIQTIAKQMSGALRDIPGINAIVRPLPNLGLSSGAISTNLGKYVYVLSGVNAEEVYECAGKIIEKMRENPGFASVNSDLYLKNPQLSVNFNRDHFYKFGVNVNKAENILKQAFSENYCYQIKADTRQYKVIVVSNDQFRRNASNLDTLYFKGTGEELLPFKTIANVDEVLGPSSVNHVNNFNSVSIFFDLKPDYPIGSAENYIIEKAKEILPEGVNGGFEGEAKTFAETFKSLTILLVVAVFVMYVILGILYESYIHPLTVLSALPVAMVGGLLTLMVFKMELSLYAFIGLFMLLGIVKKNGILMIDFAIARQKEGMAKEKAVHTACLERFRPIMMTTLAALVGNIPLAVGWGADGSSRRPLGMAIVGGLVISQIITLFILPVIYLYFEDFQENILDKIPFFSRNIKNDIS